MVTPFQMISISDGNSVIKVTISMCKAIAISCSVCRDGYTLPLSISDKYVFDIPILFANATCFNDNFPRNILMFFPISSICSIIYSMLLYISFIFFIIEVFDIPSLLYKAC